MRLSYHRSFVFTVVLRQKFRILFCFGCLMLVVCFDMKSNLKCYNMHQLRRLFGAVAHTTYAPIWFFGVLVWNVYCCLWHFRIVYQIIALYLFHFISFYFVNIKFTCSTRTVIVIWIRKKRRIDRNPIRFGIMWYTYLSSECLCVSVCVSVWIAQKENHGIIFDWNSGKKATKRTPIPHNLLWLHK